MASTSSAVHSARPTGLLDIRKAADYPIVLGESLRALDHRSEFLSLRYNWQPRFGFSGRQSNIKPVKDGYRLTVEGQGNEPSLSYSGHTRPIPSDALDESTAMALVFDKKESVFKLEAIAKSIDLNLESTSSKTHDATRHPKLPKSPSKPLRLEENGDAQNSLHDDSPDPNNPYDFRNFLTEAKENIERTPQIGAESRTPLPGSRTPMSGFASPIPGSTRFKATTPQFEPISKSSPIPKKRKTDEPPKQQRLTSPTRQKSSAQKPVKKRKPLATSPPRKPLSKETIEDSDEELSDTIVVASTKPQTHGHNRNPSGNIGRSPHIVVNHGDLEIDMGSPPQETRGRPRGRIDTGAFRSGTGTPVLGERESFKDKRSLEEGRRKDVSMKDIEGDGGEKREGSDDDREDEDDDVEELELGSPRTVRAVGGVRSQSFVEHTSTTQHSASTGRVEQGENAPTPMNVDDDDDEDLLAKEFEAALEEEGKAGMEEGFGLGISGAGGRAKEEDEESEVSEEE